MWAVSRTYIYHNYYNVNELSEPSSFFFFSIFFYSALLLAAITVARAVKQRERKTYR